MSEADYTSLVARQRTYFKAGNTRPVSSRVEQLKALRAMIDVSRDAIYQAVWDDLRRNRTEADLMDVDWSVREADYALDHLHDWLKEDHVHTPLLMEPGQLWRVRRDPLGVTLIIGAWNEPDMLTIGPLIAIAAGNTAAVKPLEICEACAAPWTTRSSQEQPDRAPDHSRLAPTEQQAGLRRVSIALRNARGHTDAYGHGCPSAPAMQTSCVNPPTC